MRNCRLGPAASSLAALVSIISGDHGHAAIAERRQLSQALRQLWNQPFSALLGKSVQRQKQFDHLSASLCCSTGSDCTAGKKRELRYLPFNQPAPGRLIQ
jgi:hypothetical protein